MPNISLRRSKQCPREGSRRPLALMLFVFLLPFWQVQAQDAEAPRVLATVGMVGDVARNVGGECVSVDYLIGSGIDPHLRSEERRVGKECSSGREPGLAMKHTSTLT